MKNANVWDAKCGWFTFTLKYMYLKILLLRYLQNFKSDLFNNKDPMRISYGEITSNFKFLFIERIMKE